MYTAKQVCRELREGTLAVMYNYDLLGLMIGTQSLLKFMSALVP